jgi:hypothetical protein
MKIVTQVHQFATPAHSVPFDRIINPARKLLLGSALLVLSVAPANAQGQIASGTISSSGSGPFTYNLSFSDAANATSPIGSVWYAWVPDVFYLPGPPISASVPPGWMANISGYSIQFVANSAAYDIRPGESLSGFSYVASFSPAQLRATPHSDTSYAYSGGLHSDIGETFFVQTVPEPSSLLLLVSSATGWMGFSRSKLASAHSHGRRRTKLARITAIS